MFSMNRTRVVYQKSHQRFRNSPLRERIFVPVMLSTIKEEHNEYERNILKIKL